MFISEKYKWMTAIDTYHKKLCHLCGFQMRKIAKTNSQIKRKQMSRTLILCPGFI